MDVFVANEQSYPVDTVRSAELARHALSAEQVDDEAELSILFVGSDHIRRLNHRYAGDDYATDVLAFPLLEEEDDGYMLGDVVICPEVAEGNARKLGHPLAHELDTLLVHGTLHLLGYDHQDERQRTRMEKRQGELLASFRQEIPQA